MCGGRHTDRRSPSVDLIIWKLYELFLQTQLIKCLSLVVSEVNRFDFMFILCTCKGCVSKFILCYHYYFKRKCCVFSLNTHNVTTIEHCIGREIILNRQHG